MEGKPGKLDDYALATRLALFLWNSEPDTELRSLAAAGRLHDAAILKTQTERLLNDPMTADTVVDVDGTALGKPRDAADASRMLHLLSGREHRVHTAFALFAPGYQSLVEEVSTTRVRFFRLEDAEIAAYVATGEPLDKAGAYGIQGLAASLVERIDGDFYTVMGFPLARFVRALRRLGFSLPVAKPTAP